MIYPIVKYGDPVLDKPAAIVSVFDDELKKLVEDMFESMYGAHGVGLAAPQIGIGEDLRQCPLLLVVWGIGTGEDLLREHGDGRRHAIRECANEGRCIIARSEALRAARRRRVVLTIRALVHHRHIDPTGNVVRIEDDLEVIGALPRVRQLGDSERQGADRLPQSVGQPQALAIGL